MKEQEKPVSYFQQPQRNFLINLIKISSFSYWQSLKDSLVMGIEVKILCVSFRPAGHFCSHGSCLSVLATGL